MPKTSKTKTTKQTRPDTSESASRPSEKKKSAQPDNLAQAFEELETIAQEFEQGDIDLEKGIPRFKRGLELSSYLKKRLQEIENEIEEIKIAFDNDDETS